MCLWRPPEQADGDPEPSLRVTCSWSKGKQIVTESKTNKLWWRDPRLSPRGLIGSRPSPHRHKEPLTHSCSWASERFESPRELAREKPLLPCYSGFSDHQKILGANPGVSITCSVQFSFFGVCALSWKAASFLSPLSPHQIIRELLFSSCMLAIGIAPGPNGGCEGSSESILLAWLSKGSGGQFPSTMARATFSKS